MPTVKVQVSGGSPESKKANTVGELKELLDVDEYSAMVNGEPADDDTELESNQFVTLTPAVKGGA